jgi:hypothetical protein
MNPSIASGIIEKLLPRWHQATSDSLITTQLLEACGHRHQVLEDASVSCTEES